MINVFPTGKLLFTWYGGSSHTIEVYATCDDFLNGKAPIDCFSLDYSKDFLNIDKDVIPAIKSYLKNVQ